ncbi:hypothetical protein DFH09DRAFT_1079172 [Mycena vulgaris]|nr:hypothetical protein DFH09DRAFT_1079172 [Mycena vulgaris]
MEFEGGGFILNRLSNFEGWGCLSRGGQTCGELDLRPATVRLHAVDTVHLPVGYPSTTFTPILQITINDDQSLRNLEIYLKSWEIPHFNLIIFEFPQPILDPQIDSGRHRVPSTLRLRG